MGIIYKFIVRLSYSSGVESAIPSRMKWMRWHSSMIFFLERLLSCQVELACLRNKKFRYVLLWLGWFLVFSCSNFPSYAVGFLTLKTLFHTSMLCTLLFFLGPWQFSVCSLFFPFMHPMLLGWICNAWYFIQHRNSSKRRLETYVSLGYTVSDFYVWVTI